ncbi:MAG: TonB-dependent receptor [Gemmatimonadetes bacterium]|nr:TonB-dependent receptor [Gemmatimonadota bacterium]
MRNRWVRAVLAAVTLSLGGGALLAQGTSGKMEGTVTDPAGQPVNGAQIMVMGTSFGTVTDAKGYYFINNVPVGTYNVRAQYIGMQPAEIQNVRVLAGQTMTVKFSLSTAVQIGGISVVAEAAPLVPRDQVTSKPIVTGEVIDDLPADDIRRVLTLQPGVVESGRTAGLSIRGGRAGEAAVYVDGVEVRSVRTGASRLDVGTNAVEEASVTTGALGAEFGDAQSGIISYVTRAGGQRFQGSLSAQTDEPFGKSISVGYNRGEASFGGPIFGNLTFFVAATAQGQKSDFLGLGADTVPTFFIGDPDTTAIDGTDTVTIPRFVQYGGQCDPAKNFDTACRGRQRPINWTTNGTANAKLQYTFGQSRLSVSALTDQEQSRDFSARGAFYPSSSIGNRSNSNVYVLNWVQQFLKGADRALALDASLSYQTDRSIGGPMTVDYEAANRDPSFGLAFSPVKFLVDFDHFSDDTGPGAITQLNTQAAWDQLIQNVRTNTGTRVPFLDKGKRFAQPYRMNPWGVGSGFPTVGLDIGNNLAQERRMYGRINMDLQLDRYNRFKFGGEAQQSRVNYFQSSSILRQTFMQAYSEKPFKYGAFGEDRLDLGDVVIVLGLRYDAFDSKALFPVVPGRTFTNPAYSATDPLNANVWKKAGTHHALSPRIQVSFPVTEATGFRLSYSHQVQTPDFNSMFQGSNNDLSYTNTNDRFGGDVDFGKTILFEFGIRHAFGQDMVLDVSAYNKDKVSDLAYRIVSYFDPKDQRPISLNVLTNADFGNVRGVDGNLIRRISNIFTGQVSYTFQIARGTGSDPFTYLSTLSREIIQVTGDRAPPAQALLPTEDNRTHNIAGSLSASFPRDYLPGSAAGTILRNAGVFATFRFASGLPYTRMKNVGGGATAPFVNFGLAGTRLEPVNSSTMPWIKSFDLRVNKGVRFGRLDATFFADFRNLFNFRNVVQLFAETGDVTNELYRDTFVNPVKETLKNEAVASGKAIQIKSGSELIDAVDLRGSCSSWQGPGGAVDCVLLRRTEARWGDGNMIFDANEQTTAFTARYNVFNGEYTNLGQSRHIRLGLELNF